MTQNVPQAPSTPGVPASVAAAAAAATTSAGPPAPRVEDYSGLRKSDMSVEEKVRIALSVGEETLTVEELTALYTARDHPSVYDGFEPSGRMHIAQGMHVARRRALQIEDPRFLE